MLHLLFTHLVASVLLAHSILGCCWHSHDACSEETACNTAEGHGHAACGHGESAASHSRVAGMTAPHVHFLPHDDSDSVPRPDESPACEHGECAFIAAKGPAVDHAFEFAQVFMLMPGETLTLANLHRLQGFPADGRNSILTGSAQLRALIQVWIV